MVKKFKKTVNPKNMNDENCIPVALNHKDIGRDSQRISKINTFITKYNWKAIEFPAGSKDWKKFEQNNEINAPNTLYVPYNT